MNVSASRRARSACLLLAPVLAIWTLAAFQQIRQHSFVDWDDPVFVVENIHIRSFSPANLKWMFTDVTSGHFHPLTWLSFAADYAIWGLDSRGFLLTNLLLHLANVLLLSHLVAVILACRRPDCSIQIIAIATFACSSLFAVHPLRVEAVAWVSDRKELLSAFFALLAIEAFLAAKMHCRRSSLWKALSALLYCCSILSKTMSLSLPILLCLLERWMDTERKLTIWRQIREKVLFWIPMFAGAYWAQHAQSASGASSTWENYDLIHRLTQAAYSLVFYPLKTLAPFNLCCLYPLFIDFELTEMRFVVAGLIVIAVAAASFWMSTAVRYALVAYALLILPVSGLAQAGPQLVADRYSYFPAMLFAVATVSPMSRFFEWSMRGYLRPALTIVTVLGLLAGDHLLVVRQIAAWKDSESLWTQALRVAPRNHIANLHLGDLAVQRGDLATAKNYFERSLEVAPYHSDTIANLGALELRMGRAERAEELYERAVEHGRPNAKVLYNYANLRVHQGRHGEADRLYLRAAALKPNDPNIHANRGRLLLIMGKLRDSAGEYAIACRIDPDEAEYWRGLGAANYSLGKAYLAEEPYRKYLALAPNAPTAYAELARCLIALADPTRRAEAEQLLNEASRRWPNDRSVRAAWDRFHRRTAGADLPNIQ